MREAWVEEQSWWDLWKQRENDSLPPGQPIMWPQPRKAVL